MATYRQRLTQLTAARGNLCVGIDPHPGVLKAWDLPLTASGLERCARGVVEALGESVAVFKPQSAFFESYGSAGVAVLEAVLADIRAAGALSIVDAKRGDIGSTAEQYAVEAFERFKADAITVNPYMGRDSVDPYLAYPDKGVILLCRTSNPGGSDLQFLDVGGLRLYEHVARLVAEEWNASGNCGLVVGATFPAEIARVRALIGDMPLLVPGIGAQGGDIAATLAAGRSTHGAGLMINSSRAILYAGQDENFAAAARQAALDTRDAINAQR